MLPVLFAVSLAHAGDPAATVLDHVVTLRVEANRTLTEEITWTIRVEDPVACSAGVLAPPGLDGASSGGAKVFEELLVVPEDTRQGTTFSFHNVRRVPPAEHSGVFLTAPDLPTERASFTIDIPTTLPLTVWADPSAVPSFDTKRTRKVTYHWAGLPADVTGQAAWSTFENWQKAGASVREHVTQQLIGKDGLGRTWAEGIEGLGLAGITERAIDAVALEPGATASWTAARPAGAVLKAGSGSPAERGLVLLSMLRLAGFEAFPGYARAAGSRGTFPVTVPAPASLPRPVVIVRREQGDVYLDPGSDRVAVPDRPASLLGATVWLPGELPVRLPELGVTDGAVAVNSTLDFAPDGSASVVAVITASGAAQEYLRDLLAPLDEAGRTEAMKRLVTRSRPELVGLRVEATGVEKPSKQLKITVSASQQGLLSPLPFGLRGTVPPLLAPALGAWLPPRLAIQETMSIAPPSAVQILGTAGPASVVHPDALVSRGWKREGQKLTFRTEVERPYRGTTPARDTSADAFLTAEAKKGVDLLFFSTTNASSAKAVRAATDLPPADRAVLEALVWLSNNLTSKAGKTLSKALPTTGFAPLVAGLQHWSDPADLRPWELVEDLAAADADRMIVAEGLEAAGSRRDALQRAQALTGSADPDVKIRALLMVERLQGPPPAAGEPPTDPPYTSPLQLLALARDAADKAPAAPSGARVAYRLAELQIEAGDTAGAEALLDKAERNAVAEGAPGLCRRRGAASPATRSRRRWTWPSPRTPPIRGCWPSRRTPSPGLAASTRRWSAGSPRPASRGSTPSCGPSPGSGRWPPATSPPPWTPPAARPTSTPTTTPTPRAGPRWPRCSTIGPRSTPPAPARGCRRSRPGRLRSTTSSPPTRARSTRSSKATRRRCRPARGSWRCAPRCGSSAETSTRPRATASCSRRRTSRPTAGR
jgi:hypothetical protein